MVVHPPCHGSSETVTVLTCVLDIGDNLTKVLIGAGVTLTPLIGVITLTLQRRITKELVENGGASVKDAVHRTESTVAALADSAGVPHPTPPQGTPVVEPTKGN
jgi:hypothetical protein